MKQILIACSMMEDEIKKAVQETKCSLPIIWMEKGLHNTPKHLRKRLQETINDVSDYEQILLAYGLCGKGTCGLSHPRGQLIIPKFDDCPNLLLCTEKREQRNLLKIGSFYLTRGWSLDPKENILAVHEKNKQRFGEEMADKIFETMYRSYQKLVIIDTNSYPLLPVMDYAQKVSALSGMSVKITEGSIHILRQLITGFWDENFIVQKNGETLNIHQWEF
ncbi:hypothetical protein FACS1894111_09230 [Clostridia bacterium]|nr:hypothetical protein FACS1894111_09230 [Clostridia bacterium]